MTALPKRYFVSILLLLALIAGSYGESESEYTYYESDKNTTHVEYPTTSDNSTQTDLEVAETISNNSTQNSIDAEASTRFRELSVESNSTMRSTISDESTTSSDAPQNNHDAEDATSNNIRVSRYLGLGYDIFSGNPLASGIDPGLKRNSLKPIKILRSTSLPNATCPERTECLQAHAPEILENTVLIRTIHDYQKSLRSRLRISGRVTSNSSFAFGLEERSFPDVHEHLAKGQFFVDHIRLTVSQQADLDYRHSQTLHPIFVTAICDLPPDYHYDEYASFLEEFGTHAVVSVREVLITVNRTLLDKQDIREAAQQLGVNITVFHEGTPGLNSANIPKNVIKRAWDNIRSRGVEKRTVSFSSVAEVPLVSGLRELAYFITQERVLTSKALSPSCRKIAELSNAAIEVRLNRVKENLGTALISLSEKTLQKFLTTHPAINFVPYGPLLPENPLEIAVLNNSTVNTISTPRSTTTMAQTTPTMPEAPTTTTTAAQTSTTLTTKISPETATEMATEMSGPACAMGMRFLGHGYDIFKSDLYAQQDPGLHASPPLLSGTVCLEDAAADCRGKSNSCRTSDSLSSTKKNVYVWTIDDFSDNKKSMIQILRPLPNPVEKQFGAASTSSKTVRRLLADGQAFIDSFTTNLSTEASANYRAMDRLDPNFIHALCELPIPYERAAYTHILREFGTHIITKVRMGSTTVERTQFPQATVLREALSTITAGGLGMRSSHDPQTTEHTLSTLQLHTAMDTVVRRSRIFKRGGIKPVVMVNKTDSPVGFTLRELPYFVTHERILAANIVGAPCHHLAQHSGTLDSIKTGLERALLEYAAEVAAEYTPGPPPATPDRSKVWPSGTYGLLEPTAGCPSGPQWKRGQRTHDSENYNTKNNWNREFSALTRSSLSRDIRLNFCTKTQTSPAEEPEWPTGSYCLFRKNDCPSGFQTSYVDHDDEDFWNGNLVNGVLPDGLYLHDTRYYFCCRKDGAPREPIELPTEKPFFLLRESMKTCQLVLGMSVTEHFLHMDCEDHGGCRLSSSDESHPGFVTDQLDWQWQFCYYQPVGMSLPRPQPSSSLWDLAYHLMQTERY
ncbi:hypothetical protein BV898_04165 [Hypsibius exemplaris]|uniref:MACPF domain-containing protein n=1 Tax=Hypsibius exemplaris TaxID=2072580 RepID=A0A1W0X3R7_HYPEX|nr:hypothetical protein BV898_04165 [Hypsibius exemplaris]